MSGATVFLPQQYKIVDATGGPITTNASVVLDNVSLKNATMAWLVLQFTQAVGFASVPTIVKGSSVATCATAGPTCRIWANEDTATTDTLVEQTAGATYTLTADVKKKQVIFQIDPASLGDSYDCVGCTIATSGQAGNYVSGSWIIQERYAGTTPPAAITD